MTRVLGDAEIEDRMSGAEMRGWQREGSTLRRTVEAHDFPTVVRILEKIVVDTQKLNRCPDIDIRGGHVLHLTLHGDVGLTDVEVELAQRIELAAGSFVRGHA
ncbi:4a-hydroxytetrahydrobiopterin dehydratase [Streptomyces piniterrae]|uniref:Putative pterin-4-alpha-carbinolamine dehydratase n=1 Tax=Streptomyces piniterrae TaxID=2571125 RepID=A0A4U0P267_9ACTN|nr:4a-hydroxytetrahydrobiopterin dehydratase [Streptomyces piniterrae]TJZ56774.1 4a-hydroxytetrahydrobiopterin dehydratase [Streptomyces piniterrae]